MKPDKDIKSDSQSTSDQDAQKARAKRLREQIASGPVKGGKPRNPRDFINEQMQKFKQKGE
jgi:hypothetical protein